MVVVAISFCTRPAPGGASLRRMIDVRIEAVVRRGVWAGLYPVDGPRGSTARWRTVLPC